MTEASSGKRGAERAPPRELKLHASILCYYESNSTIVVGRSSAGVQERAWMKGGIGRRSAERLERAREASTGNEEKGVEQRPERYNTSVDTGVVALTVKGILRRAYGRKCEKRRERNSGGFRAWWTPRRGDPKEVVAGVSLRRLILTIPRGMGGSEPLVCPIMRDN